MNIELSIENQTSYKLPAKAKIKQAILDVLIDKKIKNDIIVGLKIVGEKEIQELNKQFRQIDKPTDVLSFPIYEVTPREADRPLLLGDIVVCPESAEDDILFLIAHSTLHLLGYHHK